MKLITAKLGAEILDVKESRFYEMVRTGLLPPGVIVHLGRQIRVDQDALCDWVRAGGQVLPGGWRREPES